METLDFDMKLQEFNPIVRIFSVVFTLVKAHVSSWSAAAIITSKKKCFSYFSIGLLPGMRWKDITEVHSVKQR